MLTHRAETIVGDIPTDWNREQLRGLLKGHCGGDWGADEGDVAIHVLRSTNFTDHGTLDFDDVALRYFRQDRAPALGLHSGELLLERSGGGPTQPVGRIGFISEDLPRFWFSNFVQLLRPDDQKIDPEYLGWVLLELNQSGIIERLQHQTTQMRNLDFRDYLRVYLPRPSLPEQKVISSLLRISNAALAAAAGKVTQSMRLKKALMQQLFTRGIPSRHTRFKQTKIGEIPECWEVASIGSVLDGPPFSGVSPQSRPDPPGTPILNVECVDDGLCTSEHVSYVDVDEGTLRECRAEKNDFYVLRGNGNREYVATGGLLRTEPEQPTIFSDKLIRLRFKEPKVVQRFVPYLWQSGAFLRRIQSKAESGSGLWMISKRDIRRELFARPTSLSEQQDIVALVDAAIENVAVCHAEVLAAEHLKRSLLQNLLIGKVRVRV